MSDQVQRIYIVDDSAIFRALVSRTLAAIPGFEVAGMAADGQIALEQLKKIKVDIIIIDMEMPVMDGLQLLDELNQISYQAKTIVFSSATKNSATSTLKALNRGAFNFVLKPSGEEGDGLTPADRIKNSLLPNLIQVQSNKPEVTKRLPPKENTEWSKVNPDVIVIGCSTGGPSALEVLFDKWDKPNNIPILIVQHMPAVFTEALAHRLSEISNLTVVEAKNNELVEKGKVYIAPGNFHMRIKNEKNEIRIALSQDEPRHFVRPAVDYLFESASEIFKSKCLGFILTGMGEDGKEGCIKIKKGGGNVVIQNKATCVVYGMPGAVHEVQAYDKETNLIEIKQMLIDFSVKDPVQARRPA